MISRTVTFTDFNDNKKTVEVWFHLSRDTMFDNLDLEEEFEMLEKQFGGDKRELSKDEIIEILKLVKRLFRLSYGERSADGERFKPGVLFPNVWEDFISSPNYDAVLWDLFSNPEDIFAFLSGIMPKDLREAAQAKIAEDNGRKAPQDHLPKHVVQKPAENVFDVVPSEVVETEESPRYGDHEESIEELRARLEAAEAAQKI